VPAGSPSCGRPSARPACRCCWSSCSVRCSPPPTPSSPSGPTPSCRT
jgi:hypothetical protein